MTATKTATGEAKKPDFVKAVENLLARITPTPQKEYDAWVWKNEVLPHMAAAGYGAEYQREIKLTGKQQFVLDHCAKLCRKRGAIVALVGPRGTGKTTICAQLALQRARNEILPPWERRPPYRKMVTLIARYKALYADFGSIDIEKVEERRNQFCELHPLVVIDELHDCEEQRMKTRVLTDIVDRRYSAKNDTIVISNQTEEEFRETTSDSVLSRLEQYGSIIECKWQSFRRPKQ